jgi:hypothetical protein
MEVATLQGDKKPTIFKEWDPISLQIRGGILDFSTSPRDYYPHLAKASCERLPTNQLHNFYLFIKH